MARAVWTVTVVVLLVGCAEEPPPRTTEYFMDNKIALDSALVRCNADRERTLDDPECINARRAVARLGKIQEEEARAKREAEFQRKRAALRARREFEAQRRRDAEEQRRLQDEAARAAEAYGITEPAPADTAPVDGSGAVAETPTQPTYGTQPAEPVVGDPGAVQPASETPAPEEPGMSRSDIQSEIELLEEELKRRRENEAGGESSETGS